MRNWPKRLGLFLGTLLFLLAAGAAHANSINVTFNGVSATNPTLTINDSTLGTVTGYIDPYKGTIGGQSVLLWCVDPDQDAPPVGTTWSVNVATPGNLSSMSKTFQVRSEGLSSSQANLLYEEMASLVVMFENPANTTLIKQEIQGAIWQMADPSLTFPNPPSGFSLAQVSAYETDAKNNPLTSGFEVLTDVNNVYQEYIVMTPEPSTLLMLGLGLVCLLYLTSKRKASSAKLVG